MSEKIRAIIFDFNRTLFCQETQELETGALNVLEFCKNKNIKMCLVSATKRVEERKELIKSLSLEKYFEHIFIQEKTPELFQQCLDLMDVKASESVAIGDKVQKEARIGNQLGMMTIWFKKGKHANTLPENQEQQPTYTITNMHQFLDLLKQPLGK